MNDRLKDLADAGVSIWLDDLSRERLETGNLADLVKHKHVVGVTSNPAIFQTALSDGERAALDLMLGEERRTASFAEALGIGHLSVTEQEAVVKRTKDRIKKRIERGGSHDGPPEGDGRSSAA